MSDDQTTTRVPVVTAEVRDDGTGEISVDGVLERVTTGNLQEAGAAITTRIAELAGRLGQPVPVEVRDPDGLWSLLIHADGLVDEAPNAAREAPASEEVPAVSGATPAVDDSDASAAEVVASSGEPGSAAEPPAGPSSPPDAPPSAVGGTTESAPLAPTSAVGTASAPSTTTARAAAPKPTAASVPGTGSAGLPTLDDLLAARHPAGVSGPAEHGWRAGLRRVTFGAVKPGPGRAERVRRAESASVRRTLDGPRTVVVVNPKGGAHKTTATMLLASTFGLQRGGYTLAWDNNETRGTLGWRSTHGDHARTAVDLLNALPALQRRGMIRIGDLDGYVRTQPSEQFDVLASDESSASAASVDANAYKALHGVLSQFYRVIVVDTGNNMRASNWQAAVDAADQIVVVSTIREDTSQSAAWALDALRATGHEDAVRRAVTVLSAPDRKVDKDLRKRLRSHFGALTRAVLEVPYDRSLVAGGPIDYEALAPETRDAWLHVTSVVADGL
jgi:MinD-like ATPase involved in chromosome partitioning or flagellar assembly